MERDYRNDADTVTFQLRRLRIALRKDARLTPTELRCLLGLLDDRGLRSFTVDDGLWSLLHALQLEQQAFRNIWSAERREAMKPLARSYLDLAVAYGYLYTFEVDRFAKQRGEGVSRSDPVRYYKFNLR